MLRLGSHGSHGIPLGMGMRSAVGWEWEREWEKIKRLQLQPIFVHVGPKISHAAMAVLLCDHSFGLTFNFF